MEFLKCTAMSGLLKPGQSMLRPFKYNIAKSLTCLVTNTVKLPLWAAKLGDLIKYMANIAVVSHGVPTFTPNTHTHTHTPPSLSHTHTYTQHLHLLDSSKMLTC